MANEATKLALTPEATPARGFPGLACLKCGEPDGCTLDLQDCDRIVCIHCEAELSLRDDVAPLLGAWKRVLDWAALAPLAE